MSVNIKANTSHNCVDLTYMCVCVCVCVKMIIALWWSCLRQCATIRKDVSSIPDVVTGIFFNIILPAALWPRGPLSP